MSWYGRQPAFTASSGMLSARGTADNKNQADNTVIINPTIDTVNFLGPDEGYNLVTNDDNVKDEVAAGLYYRDIGSRKDLTVAESNVEFEGSSDSVKNVYRSKAITDVRKLITEGYLKIQRDTQDVEIATEKATL
mgnify:CR=1 FL=1